MNWKASFCMFVQYLNQVTLSVWTFITEIWINEASTKWQKQSPEPCYTNAALQQTVRTAGWPSSMPSEALRLYFWSPWSECQIHNKVCCPSSSVICSHQRQEDSSQVALILLSHSWARIDSRRLRFLHGQTETHQYTHQWCCRYPGFVISSVKTRTQSLESFSQIVNRCINSCLDLLDS